MRVLNPNATSQVNVALRYYSANEQYDLVLTNENNGAASSSTISQTTSVIQSNTNQFQFEVSGSYNEGDNYSVKILDNANQTVLFRGKLFFTTQVPQNYSINE